MTAVNPLQWREPIGSVERLWFPPPPFENWAFVLQLAGATYLIDTGTAGFAQAMIERLNERGLRVDHILLTHHHPTHAANAPRVAEAFGAQIWAHRDSAPLLGEAGVTVHRAFAGGDRLAGELEVIDAPGHAPGNVAFYWPHERVLFAGDVVMGLGPSDEKPLCLGGPHPGATGADVKADAAKLLQYSMAVCLPAHGRAVLKEPHTVIRALVGEE